MILILKTEAYAVLLPLHVMPFSLLVAQIEDDHFWDYCESCMAARELEHFEAQGVDWSLDPVCLLSSKRAGHSSTASCG